MTSFKQAIAWENLLQYVIRITPKILQGKAHYKNTQVAIRGKQLGGRSTVNSYILTSLLGEGSYGKVKLGISGRHDNQYAIKIMKKGALKKKREAFRDENGRMKYKSALDNVMKEVEILKKVHHENIVKLVEIINDPNEDKMFIVMDYAHHGQLLEWDDDSAMFYRNHSQKPYSEAQLQRIFSQLLEGLEYRKRIITDNKSKFVVVHSINVIHRDLKPQNIFEDEDGIIKIGDFGLALNVPESDDTIDQGDGTYYFMAPESLEDEDSKQGFSGKKADIWSLGITFYCFSYLRVPFYSDDLIDLFEEIRQKEPEFLSTRTMSSELTDLIKQILIKDPSKRPTIRQLKDHSFFKIAFKQHEYELTPKTTPLASPVNSPKKSNQKTDSILIVSIQQNKLIKNDYTKEEAEDNVYLLTQIGYIQNQVQNYSYPIKITQKIPPFFYTQKQSLHALKVPVHIKE